MFPIVRSTSSTRFLHTIHNTHHTVNCTLQHTLHPAHCTEPCTVYSKHCTEPGTLYSIYCNLLWTLHWSLASVQYIVPFTLYTALQPALRRRDNRMATQCLLSQGSQSSVCTVDTTQPYSTLLNYTVLNYIAMNSMQLNYTAMNSTVLNYTALNSSGLNFTALDYTTVN